MFPVIFISIVPPLEVPCKYIVKGHFQMILNVEKIIKDYLSRITK